MEKLVDSVGAWIWRIQWYSEFLQQVPIFLQDFIGSRKHKGPHRKGENLVFMVSRQYSTTSIPVQIVLDEWGEEVALFSSRRGGDIPELRCAH
jgi:hypothetical protein